MSDTTEAPQTGAADQLTKEQHQGETAATEPKKGFLGQAKEKLHPHNKDTANTAQPHGIKAMFTHGGKKDATPESEPDQQHD